MNRTLKIIPPHLPNGVTVVSTSWYVNTSADFTGTVIYESLNNSTNLFAINVNISTKICYAKAILNLSNGSTESSRVMQLAKGVDNKPLSLYVYPSNINVVVSNLTNHLRASIRPPKFFFNVSSHVSTTWRLTDSSGVPFFERAEDEDNLLEIIIPDNAYDGRDVFVVEAVYHFENKELDTISRKVVTTLNTHTNKVSLSRYTMSTVIDTVFTFNGLTYGVSAIDVTYTINGVSSPSFRIQKGLQESFTITAGEASSGTEATINLTVYSNEGVFTQTETVKAIGFTSSNVSLLTANPTISKIRTSSNMNWISVESSKAVNGLFTLIGDPILSEPNRSFKIVNGALVEVGVGTDIFDAYFVTSTGEGLARQGANILALSTTNMLSLLPVPSSPGLISPVYGKPISDYKSRRFVIVDGNVEVEIDPVSGSTLNSIQLSANEDYKIRLTDTSTFFGSSDGVYYFTGNPTRYLGNYNSIRYIRTVRGVLAICISNTKVDIFYLNATSSSIKASFNIDSTTTIPCVAYDTDINHVYIIYK